MRTRVMIAAMLIIAIVPVFAKHPGIAASAAPQPRTTAKPTIELAFAGDVHFTEQLAALLKVAPAHRLQRVKALMSGADVAVVNLETAIATSGSPAAKIYHFRAPGTALTALAAAGIDVVSMANNHAVDFGDVGLRQTLSAVQSHQGAHALAPKVVGIGSNLAMAMAPAVMTVKGVKIAIFAATAIPDWTAAHHSAGRSEPGVNSIVHSDAGLVAAVKQWRPRVDVVITFMHWGVEYTTCPKRAERSRARDLVAAGADLVIGSHPHIQQGIGMMGRSLVAYSLGNFVWFLNDRPDRASTGVLHVRVSGRHVDKAWWVATHTLDSGEPAKVTDRVWLARVRKDLANRRQCADLRTPTGWNVG